MFNIIGRALGLEIKKEELLVASSLPVFFSKDYDMIQCKVERVRCLFLKNNGQIDLPKIRKHHQIVVQSTGVQCVFVFDSMTPYQRQRLIESQIAFVIPESQVYLPFVGTLLRQSKTKIARNSRQLTFAAQKILISAIVEGWGEISMTEIAGRTGYSLMSISRFLDEIEQNIEGSVRTTGKKRFLLNQREDTLKQTFEKIRDMVRSPIIKKIPLAILPDHIVTGVAGGYTALAKLTMIADNDYPTFIITKSDYKKLGSEFKLSIAPSGDEPATLLEVWEYLILNERLAVPDPISLAKSLEVEASNDDRTNQAVDSMLRKYLW
ncbi:MAG: hypothetical protein PHC86_08945 [Eubacteriales bacterium]|nr:hypothetical protein [Eubacteriales bacterium]